MIKAPKSNRMKRFEELSSHPMYYKLFDKLTDKERVMCRSLLMESEDLDDNEFAFKVNRWMLDQERPKNYSAMWALMMASYEPIVMRRGSC